MSAEIVEAGAASWALLKILGGFAGTAILGILGWNVSNMKTDIDNTKKDLQRHEVESAKTLGSFEASIKMLIETIPRIHERLDELHDLKHLLSGKK